MPELYEQIKMFFQSGDYSGARNFLQNTKQQFHDKGDYWYYLAHSERKIGDLAQAEEFCKKSLELMPDSRIANFEMGIIYQAKGDYKKAISFLKKLVESPPANMHWSDMVDTLNSLALSYKKARDFDNALKYYNLALETLAQKIYEDIKRNPIHGVDMDDKISTEGWMRLAVGIVVKNAAKDGMKKALVPDGETAAKLLQQNPIFGVPFYDDKEGKRYILPAYFSAFSRALQSEIFFATIINNIGIIYAEQGDYKQARECFQESIEFTPPSVRYDNPHIGLEGLER